MDDIEDEWVQRGQRPWLPSSRGTGRGRGLLRADLWPPDSEVVTGRSKVNAEVIPTGYGRPRGDAWAYPVDDTVISRPTAPCPGSVGAVPLARLGETKSLDGHGYSMSTFSYYFIVISVIIEILSILSANLRC